MARQLPVYAVYTPSHEALVREFFLPSLPDDVEASLFAYDVEGPGDFLDAGFMQAIQHKLDLIVESVRQNDGEAIVWADADIQFFGSFVEPVMELISRYDMCYQPENLVNEEVNTGFVALRCSGEARGFFERVRSLVVESGRNEQPVINELLATDQTHGLTVGRFSSAFYAMTHGAPPENIILHHANGTVPREHATSLQQKLDQLARVRQLRGAPP